MSHVESTGVRAGSIIVGLCALLGGWLIPGAAAAATDDISVEGSKVQWTAELPLGWVGGSARQIEQVIVGITESASSSGAGSPKEALRSIMTGMLSDAKKMDVYFIHVDITAVETPTLSEIKVNVLPNQAPLREKDYRAKVWQAFAKRVEGEASPGAKTTVIQDTAASTGGFPAYEAVFKTVQADGGVIYTVMHLVHLPDTRTHVFQLKADSRKFKARRAEFQRLLSSVRYGAQIGAR